MSDDYSHMFINVLSLLHNAKYCRTHGASHVDSVIWSVQKTFLGEQANGPIREWQYLCPQSKWAITFQLSWAQPCLHSQQQQLMLTLNHPVLYMFMLMIWMFSSWKSKLKKKNSSNDPHLRACGLGWVGGTDGESWTGLSRSQSIFSPDLLGA